MQSASLLTCNPSSSRAEVWVHSRAQARQARARGQLRREDDQLIVLRELPDEVLGAGPLECAPAAPARPVAVHQRVVQVQHQRAHVPARARGRVRGGFRAAAPACRPGPGTSVRMCWRACGRAAGVASGPVKCSGCDAHLSLPAQTLAAHSGKTGLAASDAMCKTAKQALSILVSRLA